MCLFHLESLMWLDKRPTRGIGIETASVNEAHIISNMLASWELFRNVLKHMYLDILFLWLVFYVKLLNNLIKKHFPQAANVAYYHALFMNWPKTYITLSTKIETVTNKVG
jgi:hypothetical protein